jgi:hypothetical protein
MTRRKPHTVIDPLGRSARSAEALRQPHDRDESVRNAARSSELAPIQRVQMERARRDAEGPTRDTDCRSMPSADAGCGQPQDASLLDDVLRPGGRDAENRETATHDPGEPPVRPDGSRPG